LYLHFSVCRIKEFSQTGQNVLVVEDESNMFCPKVGNHYSQTQRHTTGKLFPLQHRCENLKPYKQ